MFKYFTFKGILCSLKKLIVPAVILVLAFAVLGAGLAFSKAESDESGEITFSVEYTASRSFIISLPDGESAMEVLEAEIATVPLASALLGNAACRTEVLDALIALYAPSDAPEKSENATDGEQTEEEKKELTLEELFGKKTGDKLDQSDLGGYLSVSAATDAPMLTLSVTAKDEDFARNILACYGEYLCGAAMSSIGKGAGCVPLGEDANVDSHVSGGMQSITPEGSVYEAMVKYAIIFAAIGAVIAAFAAVMIEFFKPTMVDTDDFSEYGVKLYGESCSTKKQKMSFAEDAALRDLKQKGAESVAVVGTLTGKRAEARRAELASRLSALSGAEIFSVDNALADFSEFEKIKAADTVILVERKGKTDRVRFERLVSLIADYDVDILGGVSL